MRKKERNRILFVVAVGGDSSGACSRSDKTPTAAPRQKKKKKKKGVETRGTCERLMTREKMVTTFFLFFFILLSVFLTDKSSGINQDGAPSYTGECGHTRTHSHHRRRRWETHFFDERNFIFPSIISRFIFSILFCDKKSKITLREREREKDDRNIVHIYIRSQIHLIKEAYVDRSKEQKL
jgi:hypothetical protein